MLKKCCKNICIKNYNAVLFFADEIFDVAVDSWLSNLKQVWNLLQLWNKKEHTYQNKYIKIQNYKTGISASLKFPQKFRRILNISSIIFLPKTIIIFNR